MIARQVTNPFWWNAPWPLLLNSPIAGVGTAQVPEYPESPAELQTLPRELRSLSLESVHGESRQVDTTASPCSLGLLELEALACDLDGMTNGDRRVAQINVCPS